MQYLVNQRVLIFSHLSRLLDGLHYFTSSPLVYAFVVKRRRLWHSYTISLWFRMLKHWISQVNILQLQSNHIAWISQVSKIAMWLSRTGDEEDMIIDSTLSKHLLYYKLHWATFSDFDLLLSTIIIVNMNKKYWHMTCCGNLNFMFAKSPDIQ